MQFTPVCCVAVRFLKPFHKVNGPRYRLAANIFLEIRYFLWGILNGPIGVFEYAFLDRTGMKSLTLPCPMNPTVNGIVIIKLKSNFLMLLAAYSSETRRDFHPDD